MKTVKYECLNYLILSSVKQLEYTLDQYQQYYHYERIHQSLGKIIEPKHKTDEASENDLAFAKRHRVYHVVVESCVRA